MELVLVLSNSNDLPEPLFLMTNRVAIKTGSFVSESITFTTNVLKSMIMLDNSDRVTSTTIFGFLFVSVVSCNVLIY